MAEAIVTRSSRGHRTICLPIIVTIEVLQERGQSQC
jgi:hypothetical protein